MVLVSLFLSRWCQGVRTPQTTVTNHLTSSSMTTTLGKRKLPRRDLPWVGTLLDKLPYSKLPTKGVVIRRLLFKLETEHGSTSLADAAITVREELVKLWEYAVYGDILQTSSNILRQIKALHTTFSIHISLYS